MLRPNSGIGQGDQRIVNQQGITQIPGLHQGQNAHNASSGTSSLCAAWLSKPGFGIGAGGKRFIIANYTSFFFHPGFSGRQAEGNSILAMTVFLGI